MKIITKHSCHVKRSKKCFSVMVDFFDLQKLLSQTPQTKLVFIFTQNTRFHENCQFSKCSGQFLSGL